MTRPDLAHAEIDSAPAPATPDVEALRERMVTQLPEEDVRDDPGIEAAFRVVPREAFGSEGTAVGSRRGAGESTVGS